MRDQSSNDQVLNSPLAGSPYTNGDHIVVPVGTHTMDGEWHYVEQDLLGIFEDLRPTWDFVQFDAMIVYAEDAYIDDIVLSGGSMARSYQIVPGKELGGTLGVQTGADGGEGVGAWETAYYHYNDLGTVLSTTDDAGDVVGAWVPDFNGNYTNAYLGGYKYTGSPDRPEIGLTGKWWDEAAGLYYFNARWLDPERARWMSKEPTGADGPNLYHFAFGRIVNGFDTNGLNWEQIPGSNYEIRKDFNQAGNPNAHIRRKGSTGSGTMVDHNGNIPDKHGNRRNPRLPRKALKNTNIQTAIRGFRDRAQEIIRGGARGCIVVLAAEAAAITLESYTALYNAEADLLDQDIYDEKWTFCSAKCGVESIVWWLTLSNDSIVEYGFTGPSNNYSPCMEDCMSRPGLSGF